MAMRRETIKVLKAKGKYDAKKLFGVTTLDVVRAKTFYAEKAGLETARVDVPVVGGHAGITILPLFSQATPKANNLSADDIDALTERTMPTRRLLDISPRPVERNDLQRIFKDAMSYW